MISPSSFVSVLNKCGINFFTGVPDSLLKSFCAFVTDNYSHEHTIASNEGGAIGLAAGHYLATGTPALVYMQNSGMGNAVNPLASLADPDVYSIPMVLLVGWRGEPGIHDEPQHIKQGKITLPLFKTIDIPTAVIPDEGWKTIVEETIHQSVSGRRPVALVVRKGLFDSYELKSPTPNLSDTPREEAIEKILREYGKEAVFVSTTGMISREVYETRIRLGQDHSRDFLTVGSMGHASMIALGVAKAKPDQLVICLDGDGAFIMQMGNMAIVGQSCCENLIHIVLNNAAHDSVGGQPTVANKVNLSEIAQACGYNVATLIPGGRSSAHGQPTFIEIKVAKGSRTDLGRPKEQPQVNKALFMKTLGVE